MNVTWQYLSAFFIQSLLTAGGAGVLTVDMFTSLMIFNACNTTNDLP